MNWQSLAPNNEASARLANHDHCNKNANYNKSSHSIFMKLKSLLGSLGLVLA